MSDATFLVESEHTEVSPEDRKKLGPSMAGILKANPYHDEVGRFSTRDAARFQSIGGVFSKTVERQRQEHSARTTVSPERARQIDVQLALAGSWGAQRGAVMDAMSEAEKLQYLDSYLKGTASSEMSFDHPHKAAIDAIVAKYKTVDRGYVQTPYDIYTRLSVEDAAKIQPLLQAARNPREGSFLAVDDIASRLPAEVQIGLVRKIAASLNPKLPPNGEVLFDPEYGAHYSVGPPLSSSDEASRLQSLSRILVRAGKLPGDVIDEVVDSVSPATAHMMNLGMFHKDRDLHKASFWSTWSATGSTPAHSQALNLLKGVGSNGGRDLWYGHGDARQTYVPPPSKNLTAHLLKTYQETQAFYEEKLNSGRVKKPLSEREITVYRGVGTNSDRYVPGTIESWSTQKSTATTFAKMMGEVRSRTRRNGVDTKWATVLTSTVKVSDVFASFESLKGWFPSEATLKGKKEHIVFGGALTQIAADQL